MSQGARPQESELSRTRVLVIGGSDLNHFDDRGRVISALEQLAERRGPIHLLLPAGEKGAAWEAWTWAAYNHVPFELYDPRCRPEATGAGNRRPDIVLAFRAARSACVDAFRIDGAHVVEVE